MGSMTRDEVRAGLKRAGATPDRVTDDDLKSLRRIISKHLRRSGIYGGTARIARAKKDLKFIEMKTDLWAPGVCREAVSFNRDGFVGIAGWADNRNVRPILDALTEWAISG